MIEIKTQLTRELFVKEFFTMQLKTRLWYIIPVILIASIIFKSIFLPQEELFSSETLTRPLGIIITYLVGTVFFSHFNAKRVYDNNIRIKETIIYTLDNEYLILKGESFETKITWDSMYKTEETKRCFLLYTSKQSCNFLPKQDMTAEQITALQALLKNIPLQKK
jgi:YcxB-like protein